MNEPGNTLIAQLRSTGIEIITDAQLCRAYGYDNSRQQGQPQAVLFPGNHQQVVTAVQLCYQHRQALITRGRGTGTTGATVPLTNEIVLSTEKLTQTLKIEADNRLAIASAGITNQQLQDAAAEQGFFWPPDPTSAAFCSLGGNLAYNSAGPRAVKYGTPRENTLGLTLVTGTGETLVTGSHTTKSVVGYDLTRLIIGSEGTLGIITEAVLKLTPKSEAIATLQLNYRDIESAAEAVSAIMAQAITPCALEMMDHNAITMIREYSELSLDENIGAILMVEIDGPASNLAQWCESLIDAARNPGLLAVRRAQNEDEKQQIWRTRKALSPALRKIAPKKINEDVVVPVSEIPTLIRRLEQISKKHQITIVNFGHAGNGNIHVNLLFDPDDQAQAIRAEACLADVFETVLGLNGSLSGEHGIGLVKKDYLPKELSQHSLQLMAQIKQVFDPANILNPGKSF